MRKFFLINCLRKNNDKFNTFQLELATEFVGKGVNEFSHGELNDSSLNSSVNLPPFRFEKDSEITDIVSHASISGRGLIINSKVYNILKEYELTEYVKHPLIVLDYLDNELPGYFFLQIKDSDDLIDFQKSKFNMFKLRKLLGQIDISSIDDFAQKQFELIRSKKLSQKIKPNVLAFKCEVRNTDFFSIDRNLVSEIIISQKLKDRLVKEKITGVDIYEPKSFEII